MKDYYKILGVERGDTIISIKRVFRRLALKMHPDVNDSSDAHEKFIELNEAYQILSSHSKRRQYDKLYNVQVLNKKPKRASVYKKRNQKWESNVDRAAKRGNDKGRKYASESKRKFKRRVNWWGSSIFFDILGEIFFRAIALLIGAIET